jgi:hypothetical protein
MHRHTYSSQTTSHQPPVADGTLKDRRIKLQLHGRENIIRQHIYLHKSNHLDQPHRRLHSHRHPNVGSLKQPTGSSLEQRHPRSRHGSAQPCGHRKCPPPARAPEAVFRGALGPRTLYKRSWICWHRADNMTERNLKLEECKSRVICHEGARLCDQLPALGSLPASRRYKD